MVVNTLWWLMSLKNTKWRNILEAVVPVGLWRLELQRKSAFQILPGPGVGETTHIHNDKLEIFMFHLLCFSCGSLIGRWHISQTNVEGLCNTANSKYLVVQDQASSWWTWGPGWARFASGTRFPLRTLGTWETWKPWRTLISLHKSNKSIKIDPAISSSNKLNVNNGYEELYLWSWLPIGARLSLLIR